MFTDRRMDKEDVIHIYNGVLLSHKKHEILPFAASWMDLEIIILSEISQIEKDKCHMTLVISKKNDTNELIYKTETDSQASKLN